MSNGSKKGERPSQENRPPQPRRPKTARAPAAGPSRMVRLFVSMALLLHVGVLFLYPLANSRTSTSVKAIAQSPYLRWYADPLYLNQGYGFFAPDPGPGMLVEYEVFDDSGEIITEGTFPDAERLWPRLRYHRYKMLADQLQHPDGEPRMTYVLERFARHLVRQHEGQRASIRSISHELVLHGDWLGDESLGLAGKPIDDKSLYRTLMHVQQTRADVERADAKVAPLTEPARRAEAIEPGDQL